MTKTIVKCYVRLSNGKRKKYRSVDGGNFKDKKGNNYNAPVMDKHEIFETEGIMGRQRLAFYREGQANPIPLDRDTKWHTTTNNDSDVDMLIRVTRAAIMEANLAEMKTNATLAGIGLAIILIIIGIMAS